MRVIYLPFILQGLVMMVDEFWAHEKRSLPKWERIGHPMDSLTVLSAYMFLLIFPFQENHTWIYAAIAVFSCLFITKDEFVHATECSGMEQWLHSLLFLLHPLTFICAGILWMQGERSFLIIQAAIVGIFMCYQIIRWSIPWQVSK